MAPSPAIIKMAIRWPDNPQPPAKKKSRPPPLPLMRSREQGKGGAAQALRLLGMKVEPGMMSSAASGTMMTSWMDHPRTSRPCPRTTHAPPDALRAARGKVCTCFRSYQLLLVSSVRVLILCISRRLQN